MAVIVSPKLNFDGNLLVSMDNTLFLKLSSSQNFTLNQFMVYLSQYGREVFWSLAILVLFIFGGQTGKITAAMMIISIITLTLLGTITKEVIERPRPAIAESRVLVQADTVYSFPSGHATIVSGGAAIALALFNNSIKKEIISLLLTTEAALVCISRMYLGMHYPLDILGGIILGVGISFLYLCKKKDIVIMFDKIRKGLIK